MEELIKQFLSVSSGSGYGSGDGYGDGYGYGDGSGYGSGDGYGDGSGYGSGSGDGYGSGYGSGYGEGSGSGYGSGDGSGDGYGSGYGDGYGSGYGEGSGYGLSTYNGQKIYFVDNTPTLIDSVHGQYAKGNIVNNDLTLTPCYVARCGDFFAHGDTLAGAKEDVEAKALEKEPIESRIDRFVSTYPDVDKAISNAELYKWHNILTGSCEFGRKQFAKDHNIDIEHGTMTIREFVELTKSAFGGEVIKRLKSKYNI